MKCEDVHDLLHEEQLNLLQKAKLRFHLFICRRCQTLQSQLTALHEGLAKLVSKQSAPSPELTERITRWFVKDK